MSQDISIAERPARRESPQVISALSVFDTARFEHMMRIAAVMADCALIPESLLGERTNGKFEPFGYKTVVANCFLVVSYAERIGFDPFLVAQSCSVVRGRLMFEGKLIAAALDAKLGVELDYQFGVWDPDTETCIVGPEGKGDALGVRVSGRLPDGTVKIVEGSVGIWKTTGDKSPWRPGALKRQCRYRGGREWARAHKPGIMLGVVTDDEMDDLIDDARARRAPLVGSSTPSTGIAGRLQAAREADGLPAPSLNSGFSVEAIDRELATISQPQTARYASVADGANAGGGDEAHVALNDRHFDKTAESEGAAQTRGSSGFDASVTSPGGEQPGSESQNSSGTHDPAGEKEDEPEASPSPLPGAGSSSTPLMTREQFRAYSMALARATKKTSLQTFGNQQGQVITKDLGSDPGVGDMAIVKKVFALHEQRVDGKIDASAIADELETILDRHFGDGE